GCTEEEVLESLEASYGYQPVSLDATSSSDSDENISLIDKIPDNEQSYSDIDYKDFVEKFINTLNELEVKIFKGRFYLEKTQSAIAKELDISQMTISRLERKIIEKLKKEYEKNI
ncbi:MAG: sigma-70 family RNA polymerase sigma factor, partial [Peptostreptococcaceae bacterium]